MIRMIARHAITIVIIAIGSGCQQWQDPWQMRPVHEGPRPTDRGSAQSGSDRSQQKPSPDASTSPKQTADDTPPDLDAMLARLQRARSNESADRKPTPEPKLARPVTRVGERPSDGEPAAPSKTSVNSAKSLTTDTRANNSGTTDKQAANRGLGNEGTGDTQTVPSSGDFRPEPKTGTKESSPPVLMAVHVTDRGKPAQPKEQPNPSLVTNASISDRHERVDQPLEAAIEQARKDVQADPTNVDKQWRLRLLQLAAGESEQAREDIEQLDPQLSEVMSGTLDATAATAQWLTDPDASPDVVLDSLERVRTQLRADAELRIPVIALCSRVEAFGIYEEISPNTLVAYRENRVIVYCEIENFTSQPHGDGQYRTLLANRIELFSADGTSVWSQEEPQIEDLCRRRRSDFFLAQLITLPRRLPAGDYVLKVTVKDLLASKMNQASIQLRLVSG